MDVSAELANAHMLTTRRTHMHSLWPAATTIPAAVAVSAA